MSINVNAMRSHEISTSNENARIVIEEVAEWYEVRIWYDSGYGEVVDIDRDQMLELKKTIDEIVSRS